VDELWGSNGETRSVRQIIGQDDHFEARHFFDALVVCQKQSGFALNRCRDQLRRRRRRTIDIHAAGGTSLLSTEDHPAHGLDTERARAAVLAAVERLPEDQKEAILLRYVSDLSYAEIARVTSTPQGTVASHVFRGLKRLGEDIDARHLEVVK